MFNVQEIPSWTYNQTTSVAVTVTFEIWNTVYIKLPIWKGIVPFRFRNKKYIKIFNKSCKHIFVSKEIDIKVTYYYSALVPQMLIFDVSKVISWLLKKFWEA